MLDYLSDKFTFATEKQLSAYVKDLHGDKLNSTERTHLQIIRQKINRIKNEYKQIRELEELAHINAGVNQLDGDGSIFTDPETLDKLKSG